LRRRSVVLQKSSGRSDSSRRLNGSNQLSDEILVAIDPGRKGGLAWFQGGALVRLAPASYDALVETLIEDEVSLVVLEKVGGVPGQSAPAAFAFGADTGRWVGIAMGLGVPVAYAPPSVWKAAQGLLRADKWASLEKAKALFPDYAERFRRVTVDDGLAEAALIGHWWLHRGAK
jgi:hypothetical protein